MKRLSIYLFSSLLLLAPVHGQLSTLAKQPPILGLGDSLGEGVQSDNASTFTQPNSYLNVVAGQMRVAFQQPLIQTNSVGVVGSTLGRSRIDPAAVPADLAVSGATLADVLNTVANTTPKNEVDLVLPPYYGLTQLQIAQSVKPQIIYCWVGTDDIIGYILDSSHLLTPSVTSLSTFTQEYGQLIAGLQTTGSRVVLGNIPDITEVGYLVDNNDLIQYLGTNYNLPPGSYTTTPTMFLIKLKVLDPSVLQDPNYVLSASQISNIQAQVVLYNSAIQQAATQAGYPVVDAYAYIQGLVTNPITIEGLTITNRYNGGAFSLDGIHPSDIGYAELANLFIQAADTAYGLVIPQLSQTDLTAILNADPFIDWNGNGVVPGRKNAGLLDILGRLVGVSGDKNDIAPGGKMQAQDSSSLREFMQAYFRLTGRNPNASFGNSDVVAAVNYAFSGGHSR